MRDVVDEKSMGAALRTCVLIVLQKMHAIILHSDNCSEIKDRSREAKHLHLIKIYSDQFLQADINALTSSRQGL